MIRKISTANMTREEWLEARKHSVGGSEVGAVLGLSPYASAVSVWANKTGWVPDAEENEAMRFGTFAEEYVAQRFSDITGKTVRKSNYIYRNDDYPHLHANVDRLIVGERAGLECKTASELMVGKYQNGEFPAHYYSQCVSYMAVLDLPIWYLCALIGNKHIRIFKMVRPDQDTSCPDWCESVTVIREDEMAAIRDVVVDFWQYVETMTMPPIEDSTQATADTLEQVYPGGDQEPESLECMESVLRQLALAKAEKKDVEAVIKQLENQIKGRLCDCECGTCEGYTVTWKPQSRTTFDYKKLEHEHPELDLAPYKKTSTSRVFRFTQKEEA